MGTTPACGPTQRNDQLLSNGTVLSIMIHKQLVHILTKATHVIDWKPEEKIHLLKLGN